MMRVTNKRLMIHSYQKQNYEIMYEYVNSCHETRLQNFKFTHTGDDSEFYDVLCIWMLPKIGGTPKNGWFIVKIMKNTPPKKWNDLGGKGTTIFSETPKNGDEKLPS